MLDELLNRKVRITEHGVTRMITLREAIYRRIFEDALKGNIKSAAFILNRHQVVLSGATPQEGFNDEDKAVLNAYVQKFQPKLVSEEK